jgi:hypothetical protein
VLSEIKKYFTNVDNLELKKTLFKGKFTSINSKFFILSQKSVSGSIAVGLFCGLLPAPFQMLTAAAIAYYFNLNLPLAILTTLYTNPLTVIPLYIFCLKVGLIFLDIFSNTKIFSFLSLNTKNQNSIQGLIENMPDLQFNEPINYISELLQWLLSIGWPLLIGTFIVASFLSIVGYLASNIIWIVHKKMSSIN